jgi:general stress protein YciG
MNDKTPPDAFHVRGLPKRRFRLRGFAAMDPERRREIAAKGGRAQGKRTNSGNFANDPARAAKAGAKGGKTKRAAQSI